MSLASVPSVPSLALRTSRALRWMETPLKTECVYIRHIMNQLLGPVSVLLGVSFFGLAQLVTVNIRQIIPTDRDSGVRGAIKVSTLQSVHKPVAYSCCRCTSWKVSARTAQQTVLPPVESVIHGRVIAGDQSINRSHRALPPVVAMNTVSATR